jgi:membrane protein DedA with SNARE-associated domain
MSPSTPRLGTAGTPVPGRGGSAGRRRLLLAAIAVAVLVLVLLVIAFLEGDLFELAELGASVRGLLNRFGVPASLALLYIEESGIPLPIPGDVYVAYLGHASAGSLPKLAAAWLGIIVVVVAGASNLYLVSRRWGSRLMDHRLSPALHLDRERVARTRIWFDRWGPLVIIFGRHIPGFRIPITVVAGTFRVRYGYFAASVAVSTAIWAGVWFWLSAKYGNAATSFLSRNSWAYVAVAVAVIVVVAVFVVRLWRASRAPRS